jgi:uncharacterized protein (TIGR02118 family)
MYILTIHYPRSEGATFDFDYYKSTHLPAVGEAFKPFGLGYASVLRGEESVGGGEPAYFVTTILSFAEEEAARNAIKSEAGRALAKDVANFTNVTPSLQFNTPVR